MDYALSSSFSQSEHMSPPAAGLALLLHAAVVFALLWTAPIKSHDEPANAIDVTIEQPPPSPPAPPTPPTPPPRPAIHPQSPGIPLGLPTPAPDTAQKPERPATGTPPQQALAPPSSLERSLPPVDAPPPPVTSYDVPAPPPPEAEPKPRPSPPPHAPAPAPPQPRLQPSPLSHLPPNRTTPQSQSKAAEPPSAFVNPADVRQRNAVIEQYLQQVAYRVSQYRFYSPGADESGVVVVRFTIGVDGGLMGASISRSSGKPALDNATLQAFRSASPFPPMPAELSGGGPITFVLPFESRFTR